MSIIRSVWLIAFCLTALPLMAQEKNAAHYNNEGVARAKQKDYPGAIESYTRAIEMDPKFAMAYYNRGHARVEAGHIADGIADYTKSIELNPNHDDAYINRGYAHMKQDRLSEAVSDLTRAIELNPHKTLPYLHRGNAHREMGRPKQAIEDYDHALRLKPGDAMTYAFRGHAHRDLKEYERAIEDWEKAIDLDPARRETLQPGIDQARERIKADPNRVKRYQEAIPPPKKVERIPMSFHIGVGMWASDWNFKARTASRTVDTKDEVLIFGSLALETGITKKISVGASYDYAMNDDVDIDLFSVYGKYLIPTAQPEWWGFPEHLDFKLGVLVGNADVEDRPGSFDTGYGVATGIDYRRYFRPNLSLDLGLDFRWIEFDFDRNSTVITADRDIGGAGFTATMGLGFVF